MKAVVYHRYGSPNVLELAEIDKPIPTADEVLVRVHASSVNPLEWYSMIGLGVARLQGGLMRPKNPRLGTDFAGVVEAVGANVIHVKPGDEVYGGRTGAYAEYIAARNAVVRKPTNISFEEAAVTPTAGITALQGLRDQGGLKSGQHVLINGASGGVGVFAVQIAKALGAKVTAVCSTHNVDQTRALGADHVIDYTRENFTQGKARFDLLLDMIGGRSWSECQRVLKPDATYVIVGAKASSRVFGPLLNVIRLRLAALGASQKMKFFIAQFNRPDLETLTELIEAGKVKPVIDRSYPLEEIAVAMAYQGEGHARAKIAVKINQ